MVDRGCSSTYFIEIHSDSQLLRDYLEQRKESAHPKTHITDGTYGGTEYVRLAEESGVELVATALSGKNPDVVMEDFLLSEDSSKVIRCPMGHEPEKSSDTLINIGWTKMYGQLLFSIHLILW